MALRMIRHYCSNCLATTRFLDLDECRVCVRCNKMLHVVPLAIRRQLREAQLDRMLRRFDNGWVPTRTIG